MAFPKREKRPGPLAQTSLTVAVALALAVARQ